MLVTREYILYGRFNVTDIAFPTEFRNEAATRTQGTGDSTRQPLGMSSIQCKAAFENTASNSSWKLIRAASWRTNLSLG